MKLRAYRIYISDCVQLLVNNVAESFGGRGVTTRLYDMLKVHPQENRTADEIIAGIKDGLRRYEEEL